MSIYRLASDAWEHILGYLDAFDTTRLIFTGDKVLQSRLKPAIRDFVLEVHSPTSPTLSSLLGCFKQISSHPVRLSISLAAWYDSLSFVAEDYTVEKWQSFFPQNLASLHLSMRCFKPPFSSLLASLASLAPRLKELYIQNAPSSLSLPPTLKILEIGVRSGWNFNRSALAVPTFIETLPTTLTHLKLPTRTPLKVTMEVSELPFRKMPLTLFCGKLAFQSLTKEQTCWSIFPNTMTDLDAELKYLEEGDYFFFLPPLSWKQLFPSLTTLRVPAGSLCDEELFKCPLPTLSEALYEEQIFSIRSSFPESLTSLTVPPLVGLENDLPLIVCALGPQLRSFEYGNLILPSSMLKRLPRWENPTLELLKTVEDQESNREMLDESENFETFFFDKNHILHRLCRTATSLQPGILPASALSFIPKSINSLEFIVAEKESLCLKSASSVASNRMKHTNIDVNTIYNADSSINMPWMALAWPPALKSLTLSLQLPQSFHWRCLPPTLTELYILAWKQALLDFEGGDLAHMTSVSDLRLTMLSSPVITALNGLPKSLQSLSVNGKAIGHDVLLNPDFQNFFDNLEHLDFTDSNCSADVLLHLPKTLKVLCMHFSPEGACLSEKHFEKISRCKKLARLELCGDAIWPQDLKFDVFSRFMPHSLASMSLDFEYWRNKNALQKEIASHIPETLLAFNSELDVLQSLVEEKITQYQRSRA